MQTPRRTTPSVKDEAYERATIELDYGKITDGVSVTGRICPKCNGGNSGEGSLAVSRSGDTLLFICHRASCGWRGRINLNGGGAVSGESPAPSAERSDGRNRYASLGQGALPEEIKRYLADQYEIGELLQAKGLLRWTTKHSPPGHGRLVLPVIDHAGYPYGYVARKLDNQNGAKTFTFASDTEGAWYMNRSSGTRLVIVEDQLSALKASQFVNAVALLGTNISEATLTAIKAGRYTDIYLALDADAFPKSIKLAVELRPHLKLNVIRLRKDLKNMAKVDIHSLFMKEGVIL